MSDHGQLIPPVAMGAWLKLGRAIDAEGPPPCADDPETWWVSPQSPRLDAALDGCSRCLVRAECAAYALLAREREGVWGGRLPAGRRGAS